MQATDRTGDPEVIQTLGLSKQAQSRRYVIWGLLLLGVLTLGGFGIKAFLDKRARDQETTYEKAKVSRRNIQVVTSATGTLKGLNTVELGAEVSGRVTAVYVDFNDRVKKGQLLAEIDPEQLSAAVDESAARLTEAEAAIRQARATVTETAQAAVRAEQQKQKGIASERDYEMAMAGKERAEASLSSALAAATVARATLKSARSRLEKTRVLSPIDGVVLARLVEAGQTVTAGFQTPLLFKLAEDLKSMSLYVYVDEADIGRAREGQSASFTVDAYPDKVFPSKVVSLRNEPKQEQNVVSYEAVLAVDNSELLLRPGMTATATIVAEERKNALAVPNAALRFTPPQAKAGEASTRADRRVWILKDKEPKSVSIKTGASDGQVTEVLGGELREGTEVLTDVVEKKK